MYGQVQTKALSNGTNTSNMTIRDTEDTQGQAKQKSVTELPDNDLIDFDVF